MKLCARTHTHTHAGTRRRTHAHTHARAHIAESAARELPACLVTANSFHTLLLSDSAEAMQRRRESCIATIAIIDWLWHNRATAIRSCRSPKGKCLRIRNPRPILEVRLCRGHSAGHGACDECLYTTCLRHRPQASAARNRSSCPFPCAGIPAARGLNRMPTVRRLNSMYQEALAINQEEAGDEEYPDREPSPPASPFTRNISNFQRRWSIGLPRARSDSVASIATM